MKLLFQLILFALSFLICNSFLKAQTPPIKAWDSTIGGIGHDELRSIHQTSDGGYILGGFSESNLSGDKSQGSKGSWDCWIVKSDAAGAKVWDKTVGGSNSDQLYSLQPTKDGGYILGAYSSSGISGDKSQAAKGANDYWVVKLDANGNKLWDRSYGAAGDDILFSIKQTTDGGYILGGQSDSNIGGDKSQASRGYSDYWFVKIDSVGNKEWDKTYGGNGGDWPWSLQQTSDGGYIMGGQSNSGISGDKSQASSGPYDYWVVKLDAAGNKMWDKTYGGIRYDIRPALQQTSDGGYILGGWSNSGLGGDVSQPSKGLDDYWVVKIDANGNKLWDKIFGGASHDDLFSLEETPDKGFILGGYSNSGISGDKTEALKGYLDYWIVKVDSSGNKLWDKAYGGDLTDNLFSLQQTTDGGFVLGGRSNSTLSGDKSQLSKGTWDYWVVKLSPDCAALSAQLSGACQNGAAAVILNVAGMQSGITSIPFWTLTYAVNGVPQTVSGSSATYTLTQNAAPGDVYSLISIVSGTCTKNLTDSLIVDLLPAAPGVSAGSNCGAGAITLSAMGAPKGGAYFWYNSPAGGTMLHTDSSGTFTTPILATTTTYYVATTNKFGCEGPRMPVVATINNLTVNAGLNDTICVNALPLQLTGFSPSGGNWYGPGVNPAGVFTPSDSLIGNQKLVYVVSRSGCTDSASVQITVLPKAEVSLGEDLQMCEVKETILRTDNSAADAYLWSDGSAESFLKVNQTGIYWVQTLKNGCLATDSIYVEFIPCLPPIVKTPFIPNIITPNHDGKNDTFRPQNLPPGKWQLLIFNRWGVKIYETDDYKNNWPEKTMTSGTYYYLLRSSEAGQQYKGWLEVTE